MRSFWIFIFMVSLGFLGGCGGGGTSNVPQAEQIRTALETKYREGLKERVDHMVSLVGEKRAKEAMASAEGTVDPAEVRVNSFSAEDIRQLDNGDVTAKVVYVLEQGDHVKINKAERVTLTKLQGKWVVINQESLEQ